MLALIGSSSHISRQLYLLTHALGLRLLGASREGVWRSFLFLFSSGPTGRIITITIIIIIITLFSIVTTIRPPISIYFHLLSYLTETKLLWHEFIRLLNSTSDEKDTAQRIAGIAFAIPSSAILIPVQYPLPPKQCRSTVENCFFTTSQLNCPKKLSPSCSSDTKVHFSIFCCCCFSCFSCIDVHNRRWRRTRIRDAFDFARLSLTCIKRSPKAPN